MLIHVEQAGGLDIFAPDALATRNYQASVPHRAFNPRAGTPPLRIPQRDILQFSQLQTEINNYWRQSAIQFINGDMDLDRDWPRYISTFNGMQVDRYIAMIQSSYDSFLANRR
jgi:putative aldouronate transport system substrate-binding protein